MNSCISKVLDHLCCTIFDTFFLGSRSGVAKSPALRAQNLWSVSVNSQQFASDSGTRNGTDSTKSMHWSYTFHPNRRRWHRARTPRMASAGSLYKETGREALRIRKNLESASANHRKFQRDCFRYYKKITGNFAETALDVKKIGGI